MSKESESVARQEEADAVAEWRGRPERAKARDQRKALAELLDKYALAIAPAVVQLSHTTYAPDNWSDTHAARLTFNLAEACLAERERRLGR